MKAPHLLAFICLLLVFSSCSTNEVGEFEDNTNQVFFIPEAKTIEIEAMENINAYRISKGLTPLLNYDLIKGQAYAHTDYMISDGEVSHDNFFQRKNYLVSNAGAVKVSENIAYGFTNAEALVNAWIKSSGHKANIEGDYTHFEMSAEKNENGKWYYTNIFIKK